jgi:S-formylglutathione hydrolase FrmB
MQLYFTSFLVILFTGGCQIEGEEDSWDFGTGAGFYVDATEDKWKKNYRMYSYITREVLCFD